MPAVLSSKSAKELTSPSLSDILGAGPQASTPPPPLQVASSAGSMDRDHSHLTCGVLPQKQSSDDAQDEAASSPPGGKNRMVRDPGSHIERGEASTAGAISAAVSPSGRGPVDSTDRTVSLSAGMGELQPRGTGVPPQPSALSASSSSAAALPAEALPAATAAAHHESFDGWSSWKSSSIGSESTPKLSARSIADLMSLQQPSATITSAASTGATITSAASPGAASEEIPAAGATDRGSHSLD